jgi:hypothetical protein
VQLRALGAVRAVAVALAAAEEVEERPEYG